VSLSKNGTRTNLSSTRPRPAGPGRHDSQGERRHGGRQRGLERRRERDLLFAVSHEGERPAEDLPFYQQIYYHKLGTPIAETPTSSEGIPKIAEVP